MRILFFISLFLLLGFSEIMAQLNPEDAGYVFFDDHVARIDILIDPNLFEELLEDNTDKEYEATFIYTKNGTDIDTLSPVGFRIRGNISRNTEKKSFKISMNSFVPGQKFYGLEKLNLKETFDCAQVRERTCWTMTREMGIPYVYTANVRLYINNEFRGMYTNVEHIDEVYLKKRYGNNSGNLYKCRMPSYLDWKGEDQAYYKEIMSYVNNRMIRHYELKTNVEEDDYSDLVHFIDVLNNTPESDFTNEIEKVLNVNNVLKFLAVEVYLGHYDSYSLEGNNYYLYHNPSTGKFEYINYDMDLTLGLNFGYPFIDVQDIYNWESTLPLRTRLLAVEEYRNRYTFYLRQLVEQFPLNKVQNIASELQNQIRPYLFDDPFYTCTEAEFNSSLNTPNSSDAFGLMNYLTNRRKSILDSLDIVNTYPIISGVSYSKHGVPDFIHFNLTVSDEEEPQNATLYYRYDDNSFASTVASGEAHPVLGYTWKYSFGILFDDSAEKLDWYILTTDQEGQTSREPREGYNSINFAGFQCSVRISELMASNNKSITDELGDRDDWIEVVNMDTITHNLRDFYLSDSYSNSNEWRLPDMELDPGEYAVFWADNETNQGDRHANFKLSSSGETVYLFENINGTFSLIDSLAFPEQESNQSYGIESEENDILTFLDEITPGYPNDTSGLSFLVLIVDMSVQKENGNFTNTSLLDVVGDFNDWSGSDLFGDTDGNNKYRQTIYNLVPEQDIRFRFRIDLDNDQLENEERFYSMEEGVNNLSFVFNNDTLLNVSSEKSSGFVIYPNPFGENLSFRCDEPVLQVTIYNMLGQMLYSEKPESFSGTITPGYLKAGMYILKVQLSSGVYSGGLVRE